MPVMIGSHLHAWWGDLRHQGLVVAPALLEEYFPDGPHVPKPYSYQRLRDRYTAFEAWYGHDRAYEQGNREPLYDWLDGVLEIFLGHEQSRWQKGHNVATAWKHETF